MAQPQTPAGSWSDPQVILTAVNVLIAFAYTILTGLILNATRKNTTATRDILAAAHRPYVGITEVECKNFGDLYVSATIENVGSVPSRRIVMDLEIAHGSKTVARYSSGPDNYVALLPGKPFVLSRTLSSEESAYLTAHSDFTLLVAVRYSGMTDKEYASESTYGHSNTKKGMVLLRSNFE